jgi:hypothetical protein
MSDNTTPLSVQELEVVLETVARNLLEKWAIEDRFTEEAMFDHIQYSVDDTAFVINNYMEVINDLMISKATENRIITD